MATESSSNTFTSEFRKISGPLGADLTRVDSSPKFTLGQTCFDTRGGEYIYLKGVASVAEGSWVSYCIAGDITAAVALATTTTIDLRDPLAVACAAVVASSYGWFQIRGICYASYLVSMALGNTVQSTATAGSMDDANTTTIYGVKCFETEGGTGTDTLRTWIQYPQAGIAL